MKNYTPISLLSVAYKEFKKVIADTIATTLDRPTDQAGFRKGYSTTHHIHTISQVIEKYAECTQTPYTYSLHELREII